MQLEKSWGVSYLQGADNNMAAQREGKLRAATTQAGQQPHQQGSAPQHQGQARYPMDCQAKARQ